MGFVYKPIPPDIWAKMPPKIREQAYRQARAFLVRVQKSQSGVARFGGFILIAVTALAVMLALGGATINWH